MKYFFDTEFETSVLPTGVVMIAPISIGIACEDGRDFYAEFHGAKLRAMSQPWLAANVAPHLTGEEYAPSAIAAMVEAFCRPRNKTRGYCNCARGIPYPCPEHDAPVAAHEPPTWVAGFGGFDWVVLSSIWGGMMAMPDGWPYHFVEAEELHLPRVQRVGTEHNALGDAQTLRSAWQSSKFHPADAICGFPRLADRT